MKASIRHQAFASAVFIASTLGLAHAAHHSAQSGNRGSHVTATTLNDPDGVSHSRLSITGRVGVVIFSVPDMSQGPSQRRWSKFLADDPATRLPDTVALVLVENMAEAGLFRDQARQSMHEQFQKKKRPFLLLDETGATFHAFQIPRDRTEILVFDKTGTVRDVEQNLDDREQTINRLKTLTQQLSGHRR